MHNGHHWLKLPFILKFPSCLAMGARTADLPITQPTLQQHAVLLNKSLKPQKCMHNGLQHYRPKLPFICDDAEFSSCLGILLILSPYVRHGESIIAFVSTQNTTFSLTLIIFNGGSKFWKTFQNQLFLTESTIILETLIFGASQQWFWPFLL